MTSWFRGSWMIEGIEQKPGWKQRLAREMIRYGINIAYLFLFLGTFSMYRRLILAQHQISYLQYGVSLVEAIVLAKVIMIGEVLHLDRGFEHRPLIFPTLYKTVIFSILVGVFTVIERMVIGLIRGRALAESFQELVGPGRYELLARCLVTFLAFIPFFAIRELTRVFGLEKMKELFFGPKHKPSD
jgi:hypothetical protein